MLQLKSPFFFLFVATLFIIPHGFSYNLHPLTSHLPEIGGRIENSVLKFYEDLHGKTKNSTTLVLAAERTRRKDPTNGFKYYTGGWNISNNHYYHSAAYTAFPLFIIATIWLAGCGFFLLLLSFCYCCCRKKSNEFPRRTNAFSLTLLSLFTVSTVVGCIVLYTGQGKFVNTTLQTLQYVMHQANTTTQSLKVVSKYVAATKGIRISPLSLPSDVLKSIGKVESKIDFASNIIESKTFKNKNKIDAALNKVSLALIIVAALVLLLALLGFSFSILGFQPVIYILVTIGWILVAGTLILCGLFLVLHNILGDTCVAMDEWVQNPTAHTAVDDILTCIDNVAAKEILTETKDVTYLLVGMVNKKIAKISNIMDQNQSRQRVPLLCNPFNGDLSDRMCAPGELNFTQAVKVWKNYVCIVSSRACTKMGGLTPSMYNQMNDVVDVSLGMYHYGPFLVSLLDCSFVRETLAKVHRDDCPGLTKYSKHIYIALVMVSVVVMICILFWVLFEQDQGGRNFSKIANSARVGDSFGKQNAYS